MEEIKKTIGIVLTNHPEILAFSGLFIFGLLVYYGPKWYERWMILRSFKQTKEEKEEKKFAQSLVDSEL